MKNSCFLHSVILVLLVFSGCTAKSGSVLSNTPDGSTPKIDGNRAALSDKPLDGNDTALPGPRNSSPNVLAGRQLFEIHCSGCHPGGQNRMQPNKPVLGSDELASVQKFSHYLRNPGPGMQVFSPSDLPENQVQQLYVALQDAQASLPKSSSPAH